MKCYSIKQAFGHGLDSERLILKPFALAHITTDYIDWLNNSEVVKYSNQRFKHHTWVTCVDYLNGFEATGNLFINIEKKEDGLCVGTMTAYVSEFHQTVDVGIMIGRLSVWRVGIGYEAWSLLLSWLLEQESVRKVTAGTMRCNIPMIKIFERSGMRLEAVRPNQELLNGEPQDILYYGKFKNS